MHLKNLYIIVVILLFSPESLWGQLRLKNGSSMVISSGTKLSFRSADSVFIESGASCINDGEINCPINYHIREYSGYPIIGSGFERAQFVVSNALIKPGNLGLQFQSTNSNDSGFLERYHDTLPLAPINTVKRNFKLFKSNGDTLMIHHTSFWADTSEFINPTSLDWVITVKDQTILRNLNIDSSGTIFSFSEDTISEFNFGLAPFKYEIDNSLTTDTVCIGDSIHITLKLFNAFPEGQLWYAELSDESGTFSTPNISDSAEVLDSLIKFSFPTNTLIQSNSYWAKITSSQSSEIIIYSDYFNVIATPPLPLISYFYDTLFCQNYPNGTIQWFQNGSPILGANDSILIVNSNDNYSVEFTNENFCSTNSSFNYVYTALAPDYNPSTSISVFPNPATDILVINSNSTEPSLLTIYDSQGKLILIRKVSGYQTKLNIQDLNIDKGVYFAFINEIPFKLVKQ